jgi:ribosomal protein L2
VLLCPVFEEKKRTIRLMKDVMKNIRYMCLATVGQVGGRHLIFCDDDDRKQISRMSKSSKTHMHRVQQWRMNVVSCMCVLFCLCPTKIRVN